MSAFYLKLFALTTMMIDHVGAVFFTQYPILRVIGRLSFPIYCFLLVEGYFHTKDIRKYALRLLLFAFISEVPFDYAFFGRINGSHQNIFFTLFLGLMVINLMDSLAKENRLQALAGSILVLFLSEYLATDYGSLGILYIITFYLLKSVEGPAKLLLMTFLIAVLNLLLSGGLQNYSALSAVFIYQYNGSEGPKNRYLKYGFYIMYPLHLSIIYLVKLLYF